MLQVSTDHPHNALHFCSNAGTLVKYSGCDDTKDMTACIAWLTHDGSHRERFILAAYFVIASQSIVKLNLAPALPNMVFNCSEVQIHINQLQNNRGRVTYM